MLRWTGAISCGFWLLQGLAIHAAAADPVGSTPLAPPVYRIETEGFEASETDIRGVLDSASRELWKHFPDCTIEPLVVTRGRSGPITLFKRNDRGEIVIRLDTGKTFWSQYAYQFAHEFCHVLCGFRDGYQGNRWFEETLCETASLYAIQSMSRTWKTSPPFSNWRDYRDSLRDYVDDVLRKRDNACELYTLGMPQFYRTHQAQLAKEPAARDINGAMALVFLHLFEQRPERWEAVRWLNSSPPSEGDSFAVYLQKWHDACPARHQSFVKKVADLYGTPITSKAPPEPVAAPQKMPDSARTVPKFGAFTP